MRVYKPWKYSLGFASDNDLKDALGLINTTMKTSIDEAQFKWLQKAITDGKVSIAAAKEPNGTLAASMCCYQYKIRIGDCEAEPCVFVGQLCAAKPSAMRIRGAATELLQWLDCHCIESERLWMFYGLIGEKLAHNYYHPNFGIATVWTSMQEWFYADIAWCAETIVTSLKKIEKSKIFKPRMFCLKDLSGRCVLIEWTTNSVAWRMVKSNTVGSAFIVSGVLWPFVYFVSFGRAQRTLINAIIKRKLRIGWNPFRTVAAIKLLFILYKVGMNASTTKSFDNTTIAQ